MKLYLDYAAATPVDRQVAETVAQVMVEYYANPTAAHELGLQAAHLLDKAREQMAHLLHVKPNELIFTSGATESNNLALKGVMSAYRNRGRHLITTSVEHSSIHACCQQLMIEDDCNVTMLPVNQDGFIQLTDLEAAITNETVLISISHAIGEIGSLQPIAEVGSFLKTKYPHIIFHVDASQTLGKLSVQPKACGIDLISGSAQKWYGPKGVGFLYCREGIPLQAQVVGGDQQRGVRAGTENVALIAGMAKAMRIHQQSSTETARLYQLRQYWLEKLMAFPDAIVTGTSENKRMAPHIVHFCLPRYRAEIVVRAMSARGIYVSSQAACSSHSGAASRVLLALGKTEDEARSGIRISFDANLQFAEVDYFFEALAEVLHTMTPIKKERQATDARNG
jgi:cysteine desulfurase